MVAEKINTIIADTSPIGGDIAPDRSLKDDLGIDSLRLVELLVELEDTFKLEFELADLDVTKLLIVADVYELMYKYTE